MTDQQKKAVEEAAIKEHKFNHIKVDEVSFRLGFEVGAEEVLNNPEKYGFISKQTYDHFAAKYRSLMEFYDKHVGTPCEEIRHRAEVEQLKEENTRLRSVLKQIAEDKKEEYLNATDDVRLKAISILAKGALKG